MVARGLEAAFEKARLSTSVFRRLLDVDNQQRALIAKKLNDGLEICDELSVALGW